jgi:glycosyltransferase involved in cell wall biosynthesis
MRVLFLHQAFPAQFGQLALELTRRYGWLCSFLVERLSRCPTPSRAMVETLDVQQLPLSDDYRKNRLVPWPQSYGRYLELAHATFEAVRTRPELRPDLVVAHGGCGAPALFLRELLDCPIVVYSEYYFARSRCDLSYRVDLPPAETAGFYPRCINAISLVSLINADAGYAPTEWQRQSFPQRFHSKIAVHFDGIDTGLYRPRAIPRVIAGHSIAPDTRIVTYVARGLESMRGFDRFMQVAQRITQARSDVLFVVVGGDEVHYGWDLLHTGQASFKQWVLSRTQYDLSRFIFIEHLEPARLADVFCLSDLHIYLTVPFVLSWSFFDALASGCVVLASDVDPVREVIEPGRHGLVAPFFNTEALTDLALRVLAQPREFRPLGEAARQRVEERYSLEIAVPELKRYFESLAAASS